MNESRGNEPWATEFSESRLVAIPSGKKTAILISPKLKEEFLNDLAEATGMVKEGMRLVWRDTR